MSSFINKKDYLKKIQKRSKNSRINYRFQMVGLDIAMHLEDERHKSLYIKLAKYANDADSLLALAKDISDRPLKNKGAYFMKIITKNKSKFFSVSESKKSPPKAKLKSKSKPQKSKSLN